MNTIIKKLLVNVVCLATVYTTVSCSEATTIIPMGAPTLTITQTIPLVPSPEGFLTSSAKIMVWTALAFAMPIVAKTIGEICQEVWKKGKEAVTDIYKTAPKIAATSTLLISAKGAYGSSTPPAQLGWAAAALISAGYLGYAYTPAPPPAAPPRPAAPTLQERIVNIFFG